MTGEPLARQQMAVLIGSRAVAHWVRPPRVPKDWDYWVHTALGPGVGLGDVFSHPALDDWIVEQGPVATLDQLYTMKVSHSHWELPNGSWRKHMFDVVWLRNRGAKLDEGLYSLLVPIWREVHGAKKTNLAMSKRNFFADAVKRVYDHDSIHASVAYGDRPLYERFLKPGEEVEMDMDAVWAADFDTQIMLFREEVYATALERILIPNNYSSSPGAAYLWALRRTITSLTRGRASRFMIENYDRFWTPKPDYMRRHLNNRHKLIPLEKQ